MKKNYFFILYIFIFLFILGCGDNGNKSLKNKSGIDPKKPLAWGNDYSIYIFADNENWKKLKNDLQSVLSDSFKNINSEYLFEVKRAEFDKMNLYYKYKNLIFISDLNSNESIANYVKEKVSLNSINDVKKKGFGFFKYENLWANDQLISFVIGKDKNQLYNNIAELYPVILKIYKDKLKKRIKNKLTAQGKRKSNLMEKMQISVFIPKTYLPYKENEEQNYVSFYRRNRKKHYDRFFSLSYVNTNNNILTEEWLINKRNEIGKSIYDGDVINNTDLKIKEVTFNGMKGLKLLGRWQNDEEMVGGFFETFAYYSPQKKIIAIFDGYVYFPQGDKLPGLLELEVISNTLKIH